MEMSALAATERCSSDVSVGGMRASGRGSRSCSERSRVWVRYDGVAVARIVNVEGVCTGTGRAPQQGSVVGMPDA